MNKEKEQLGWTVSPQSQPAYPAQPEYSVGYAGQPTSVEYPKQYNPGMESTDTGVINDADTVPLTDVESQKSQNMPENFGSSFSSREIRHAFVRKVYIILTVQLAATLGVVAVFSFHKGVQHFVQTYVWVCVVAYVVFFVTYFTLICSTRIRRQWPDNLILLTIFTLAMAYLLGVIASFHETEIVIFSVGVTALICFLITMFAVQTKIDFTGYGVYLFIASWVVFIFGVTAIFVRNPSMNLVYSGLIVLLFSMYLIFDTQLIIGGKKHDLSAEEHITGALFLYLDIVNIFLAILSLSRR